MAVAVTVIALLTRHTTLQPDEWSYAYRLSSQPLAPAIFNPPYGGYLIAVPMLVYAGLLHVFGLGSYVPYRIVGLVLLVAADALFFELARRRIGPFAALAPAVVLLFLGAGSEVVLLPVRMPSQIALVTGLGMLLALERRDRPGDIAACVLLVIALTSHPLGIAFAAAAIAALALRPAGERLSGWWIVVPSIALLALWWATLHGSFPHSSSPSPGDVVSFAAESFTAVCAAATGLFRAPWAGGADFINPASIAVAIAVGTAIVARAVFRPRLPATAWVALVAFLVAVAAPAFGPSGYLFSLRQPDASRYLFPDVLLLYLVGAELMAGLLVRSRARTWAVGVGALVLAVSLASNVRLLIDRANDYEANASIVKSKLAGANQAATRSAPFDPADIDKSQAGFLLAFYANVPQPLPGPALAAYYTVDRRFGSPAYTTQEVSRLSVPLRRVWKAQYASALRLNRGQ